MVSRDAWKNLTESAAKSNGYNIQIKKVAMKGKGELDVYHVFAGKQAFYSKFKNALQKADNNMASEFKVLKNVFTKDRKAFMVDVNKLGELVSNIKKNMTMLVDLQKETQPKKEKKNQSVSKKQNPQEDDFSDEDDYSSSDDEQVR